MLTLLLLLLLQAPAPVPKAPPADPATVVAKVETYMQTQAVTKGFSGAILLAKDGKPLIAKAYGFANVEWQIPNTTDTKFRIGSLTKQFTAMAIMKLREQGKLKVEDSVCVYVSPCPEAWKPVTIHHLLTHTSGIPSYTQIPEWRRSNMQTRTIDEVLGIIRDRPLLWVPGEKYAYNNSGFFLLGVVIEKVTGEKYEDVVRTMIFQPLGMKNTGYDWTSTIIPKRAAGYVGVGAGMRNANPIDMQQPFSAGALYSTVEDLLIWDQALYGEALLPAAAKEKMWTPFLQNYAYGWTISPPSPGTFGYAPMGHSGGIDGFNAHIFRLPEARVTVIVLGNNRDAGATAIARALLAIYFGQPVPNAAGK